MIRTRGRKGSSLAEFGPAMWIFLVFVLIPLIDLISFAIGVGTVMFISSMGARNAAPCATFTEALAMMPKTEAQVGAFKALAILKPTGGVANGSKVRVTVTAISGGASSSYNGPGAVPNKPPTDPSVPNVPAQNTMNCVYQYVVTASYDVLPLFNFNATPFLHDVPALGKPVPIVFTTTATVEHPEGLNQ